MEAFLCNNCEHKSISINYRCPECGSSDFERIETSNKGEVFSFTTIHVAPPEFVDLAPYQVVLVQLSGNLRVTGFMNEEVQIGDRVSLKEVNNNSYEFIKES